MWLLRELASAAVLCGVMVFDLVFIVQATPCAAVGALSCLCAVCTHEPQTPV